MIEKLADDTGTILLVKTGKKVTLQSMLDGIKYLETDSTLSDKIRILEDARGVVVNFTHEDVPILIEKISGAARKFSTLKHAVVLDDSYNTALATLVEVNNKAKNYQIKAFSTLQAAEGWLDII